LVMECPVRSKRFNAAVDGSYRGKDRSSAGIFVPEPNPELLFWALNLCFRRLRTALALGR
jgi:hypothetical protein